VASTPSLITSKEKDKFVLLPENHDHTTCVFGSAAEGMFVPPSSLKGGLPPPVDSFIGRNVDMYHVMDNLNRGEI